MSLVDNFPQVDAELLGEFNKTAYNRSKNAPAPVNFQANPTAEEMRVVNQIKGLFQEARSIRRPKVAEWNRAYRLLRGRFWNNNARLQWMPTTSIPEIFSIIRTTVGWMTDRRFHHVVSVASAPFTNYYHYYDQLALDLETVLDATWQVNKEEAEITMMLWDACLYGTGLTKTTWDNSLAGGMGDAKICRVDPYGFYPDPSATGMDDSNYFIEVKKMSLQELDRRFPGSGKKFSNGFLEDLDEAPSQYGSSTSQIPMANPASLYGNSGSYGLPGQANRSTNSLSDSGIVVFEAWLREHEVYKTTVTDPERGDYEEEHVYDTWRVIVVAGNHVLMNERADDLWDHGKHPYSRFTPYDIGEFWGISMVELLASSQETINRLLAAALQNIELTGNPIFVEDNRAGTQRQAIYNKPGQRFTKNSQGNVAWMEPPRIQADIPNFLTYILGRMQVVAGLSDQSRGSTPKGRNSTSTMEAVQESAFVGIRMALRQLEYTLGDAGYKKASLIIENYTVPRMVATCGPSGVTSTLALRARHFMMPTSEGATPMQYTLQINAGSNDETSRQVREDKAMTLFTLGGMDIQSLLEVLNIPHPDQVMQRLQQQASMGIEPPGKRQQAQH